MRYAICNEMFGDWTWERVCDFARETGYEGIEVAPFTLAERAELVDPARRVELRRVAESRGLRIIGLHWLLVKPEGMYVTHPDAEVRGRTADYFCRLVELCADLGGELMVIGSPKQRSLMAGVTRECAMGYCVEVFGPAVELAAGRGVTLAIEPLAPVETDFLTCAADGIELIGRVGHPNFRLHLDVKAMSAEARPIPEVIRESAPYLAHFHANDPNLRGPGMGDVQFPPILGALRDVGYGGWISVEVFDFTPGPETIARESIANLRAAAAEVGLR